MANEPVVSLLNEMYKTSMKAIFLEESRKTGKKEDRSVQGKKEGYLDFIRYYKTFIFLSIHLSIEASSYGVELVPYKENIQLFKVVYELERDSKLYLLLEGISLLIIEGSVALL